MNLRRSLGICINNLASREHGPHRWPNSYLESLHKGVSSDQMDVFVDAIELGHLFLEARVGRAISPVHLMIFFYLGEKLGL